MLYNVEHCYAWRTATVYEPGISLRRKLSFASTLGHHVGYLNDLLQRFNKSGRIKKLENVPLKCHKYRLRRQDIMWIIERVC